MDFNFYQKAAIETAIYPSNHALPYTALGLAGEAGEIANKVKKIIRDDDGKLIPAKREQLISELGDVMWYAAALATELNISLDVIAHENLRKLSLRKEAGTLKGSGDDR